MNEKLSTIPRTVRALIPCLVLLAFSASGASFDYYLVSTGPVPLRFELALARSYVFPRPKPVPPAVKKNEDTTPPIQTAAVAKETTPAGPAAVASTPAPMRPAEAITTAEIAAPEPSRIGEAVPPPAQHASAPASDMLVITPQMLADFLSPYQHATNGSNASVIVPVPVSFIAPTEKEAPSSRATYKTQ